ncbi:hypothetical protein ABZX92_38120 [Lentzea sp. NPDC006480]|uniref:hypothetical protein n=1 Tax=Lentzea sp. NPDC006480 TaxID=3157176 RepID=UPI0033AB3244
MTTTMERFDLRLTRASLQYAIDYGWTTEVSGTRLLFSPASHVIGLAVPCDEALTLAEHLSGHRLSYPAVRLPHRPESIVFLAVPRGLAAAPWPLVEVMLPPSQAPEGPVVWAVPPRRSPQPIPSLVSLLSAVRTVTR